jgi:hypothetical protein
LGHAARSGIADQINLEAEPYRAAEANGLVTQEDGQRLCWVTVRSDFTLWFRAPEHAALLRRIVATQGSSCWSLSRPRTRTR